MARFLCLCLTIFMAACAGSPWRVSRTPTEELRQEKAESLCNAYAFARVGGRFADHPEAARLKTELLARKIIPDEEWSLIEKRRVAVGMSRLALICAIGWPSPPGEVHKIANDKGEVDLWVYKECSRCSPAMIYIQEDRVIRFVP